MSELDERLEPYAGRDDMSIEELVDGASELLEVVAPEQTRQRVNERPDVRTIRYYTSQGLLPRPVSYEGGRARYTVEHLLRLLLIKKMQADYKTLRQIRRELDGTGEDAVLARLHGEEAVVPRPPPAPASKALRVESQSLRRFDLGAGAMVDVPESLLQNEAGRTKLSQQLRKLADELAATPSMSSDDT